MTKAKRFLVALASAGMLLIGAAATPIPAAAQGAGFDGTWSVVIETLRGSCPSGVRYAVQIYRGRVFPAGGGFSAGGAVAPNGAISVTVSNGQQSASGGGRLSGSYGGGSWITSDRTCSGRWSAQRTG
jgi:hypothetical protein